MKKINILILLFFFGINAALYSISFASPISNTGIQLSNFLDQMDVMNKWQAGDKINWDSGESLRPSYSGKSSHCSAFVAATAKRLGIYILRPPSHSQRFLANPQMEWLQTEGIKQGWFKIQNSVQAQKMANRGYFVVAGYLNPNPNKSGHIAIVRPSTKTTAQIHAEGPQIIQAGRKNYNSTSLKQGFKYHPGAFKSNSITFYAHKVQWKNR